jgi:hypothetical protein
MSIAFKPDVTTLQIVEVNVSTSQKMGKPSCMSAGRSAEQKFVNNCINGLSRKLKVMRQSGNPSRINVFMSQKYGAKVHIFDTLLRHYLLSFSFILKMPR